MSPKATVDTTQSNSSQPIPEGVSPFSRLKPAKLALEDGSVFPGYAFGAEGTTTGEVVFNTSMTGYQEILTDPSYRGQIVTMTYPEMGNYGINEEDVESRAPHLAGFIVRNVSRVASNFRSSETLGQYLKKNNIVGISDVDTRAIVKRIRTTGALRGVISSAELDSEKLVEMAKSAPGLLGRDLVQEVLPEQPVCWENHLSEWWNTRTDAQAPEQPGPDAPHIVALDFGMKWNIARHLFDQGCRVTVLPGTSTPEQVIAQNPDGVFLSNGPGDPEPVAYAIDTIKALLGKYPIFGICLGHQLFALACGAKTFKMKFGHRGANQPVQDHGSSKIEITCQNHGFAVERDSLPDCLEVTHVNLNDDTIAGLRHKEFPAFSVQYHPEASAGPHDSQYLFGEFKKLVEANRQSNRT
jgi:carbamoyl-phosphate synthase small subunit